MDVEQTGHSSSSLTLTFGETKFISVIDTNLATLCCVASVQLGCSINRPHKFEISGRFVTKFLPLIWSHFVVLLRFDFDVQQAGLRSSSLARAFVRLKSQQSFFLI